MRGSDRNDLIDDPELRYQPGRALAAARDEGLENGGQPPATSVASTPPDIAEQLELLSEDAAPLHVYAGVDFVSQYISRGLVFVDEPSVQPWIELAFLVTEDAMPDGPIGQVRAFVGNWNSVSDNDPTTGLARTGRRETLEEWYEADLYAGVRVELFERTQASLRFNWYTSPSDSFQQIQELDLRFSYDDTALWSDSEEDANFALTPTVRIAKETRDSGGPAQWYFSPRITPSFTIEELPFDPRIRIPIALGFGANGQYIELDSGNERHFGFVQTGLGVDVPVDFLGEGGGSLTLSIGLDVIILADEALSVDGDQVETVGRVGITYAF